MSPSVVPCIGRKRITIRSTSQFNVATDEVDLEAEGKCANVSWVNDTAIGANATGLECKVSRGCIEGTAIAPVQGIFIRSQLLICFAVFPLRVENLKLTIRGRTWSTFSLLRLRLVANVAASSSTIQLYRACCLNACRKIQCTCGCWWATKQENKLFESSPPEIDSIDPQSGPSRGGYRI